MVELTEYGRLLLPYAQTMVQTQADCDAAQYRQYAGHPGLSASTYKLSCHLPNGRGPPG